MASFAYGRVTQPQLCWRDFLSTTRVHLLATELGVKSKAIIDKCKAEGLDNITNHMSTISAGLAATIREWFSEGIHDTAVETHEKVDLEKVRVKRRRKAKESKSEEVAVAETAEAVTETLQPPAEEAVVEVPLAEEVPIIAPPVVEMPVEPAAPVQPPKPPEPIMPAGPMLEKPTPAQLSGPRVVRVEAPEPERPIRARTRPAALSRPQVAKPPVRPHFDQPATEPLMPEAKEGIKGKKGGKDRTHGRRHETEEETAAKKSKLLKWRERDMEERRLRLEAAGGESLRMRPYEKLKANIILTLSHINQKR